MSLKRSTNRGYNNEGITWAQGEDGMNHERVWVDGMDRAFSRRWLSWFKEGKSSCLFSSSMNRMRWTKRVLEGNLFIFFFSCSLFILPFLFSFLSFFFFFSFFLFFLFLMKDCRNGWHRGGIVTSRHDMAWPGLAWLGFTTCCYIPPNPFPKTLPACRLWFCMRTKMLVTIFVHLTRDSRHGRVSGIRILVEMQSIYECSTAVPFALK